MFIPLTLSPCVVTAPVMHWKALGGAAVEAASMTSSGRRNLSCEIFFFLFPFLMEHQFYLKESLVDKMWLFRLGYVAVYFKMNKMSLSHQKIHEQYLLPMIALKFQEKKLKFWKIFQPLPYAKHFFSTLVPFRVDWW